MALGGGSWVTQNKILAGSYINFVSADRNGSNLADRGVVALPISLNWGKSDTFKVNVRDFNTKCEKLFGYAVNSNEMQNLREVFKHAKDVFICRLNGDGKKAENEFAIAQCGGTRGNDISIIITANLDQSSKFDVKTMIDSSVADVQTVASATELKSNDFVTFKADATLTAKTLKLEGGTNSDVTGTEWTKVLNSLESESFNVLICDSTDDTIKNICVEYVKRLREDNGIKFQLVAHKIESANYESVISVENNLIGETDPSAKLVYWVGGVEASCEVNKSCTNRIYDGELDVYTKYTQLELEEALLNGKLILHKVGDDVRILEDINTLTTFTTEKNDGFKYNQTIRVNDNIATALANKFNTLFIGRVQNDEAGRISLWNECVKYLQELQKIRAIENFEPDHVTIQQGEDKKAVLVNVNVSVVNAMAQMYMTVVVA
jgi:hypothetical protein